MMENALLIILLDVILLVFLLMMSIPLPVCFLGALMFLSAFGNVSMKTMLVWVFSQSTGTVLLASPLFILAGTYMGGSGIAKRLLDCADSFIGHIKSGLGTVAIIVCAVMGAISGSGFTGVAATGPIMIPRMEEQGYERGYATALVTVSSVLGLLIPPSNVMITYSLVSGGTSVAALFMAGYIPGILWGLACMLVVYVIAKKKGYRAKKRFTASEAGKIILQALPCLLLIVIVIGGIIFGIFTATEGSVVAVVYSLLLSLFVYKSIKIKELPKILLDSAEMTGIIIFLIGVSSIMSWVMAFTNIPELVSTALLSVSSNKFVILFLINIILLIVGTFMDMTPACLIFTPIFLPVCTALGMTTIHFGIMMIFNLCIGTITPPVGTTLFVGVKVGGVRLEDVIKQLLPFFAVIIAVLLLVTYVPTLSLWLPSLMGYV